jgi:hypothetical protein
MPKNCEHWRCPHRHVLRAQEVRFQEALDVLCCVFCVCPIVFLSTTPPPRPCLGGIVSVYYFRPRLKAGCLLLPRGPLPPPLLLPLPPLCFPERRSCSFALSFRARTTCCLDFSSSRTGRPPGLASPLGALTARPPDLGMFPNVTPPPRLCRPRRQSTRVAGPLPPPCSLSPSTPPT